MRQRKGWLLVFLLFLFNRQAMAFYSDIDFHGILVSEPCVVAAGNDGENVVVDFGTITNKTFYSQSGRRTWLQPFHILLKECDLSIGKNVKLTFLGAEDNEQPGLLAISSNTGVAHVAVGLVTSSGANLDFNKQTDVYALNSGSTQLNFKAYIQASDVGVKNRSVGLGLFNAVTTFELEYP